MQKIKKFFKVLSLFIFCLQMIYNGHFIQSDKYKLSNFVEIWKYCEAWERGDL